jgi:hypothetical protein
LIFVEEHIVFTKKSLQEEADWLYEASPNYKD